jgi:uncharacterized Zn finger protein (UPF0148 family)
MNLEETATTTTVECPKCGAEVRDGSVFCYNCGGRVAGDEIIADSSSVPVKRKTTPAPGLRSARDLRRRERTIDRKPTTIVWEPVAEGPDHALIVATVLVIAFTIVVIGLVFYLR